ncbi:MAG: UbiA prenyltransferase family protein [Chthonomonas sp.]
MRPKQWTKNLLVFAAVLFVGRIGEPEAFGRAVLCFVAMCMTSSAVYVWNDLLDQERDRAHPIKKNRPLASGDIGPNAAVAMCVALLAGGLGIAAYLNTTTVVIVAVYLVMQVLYNLLLKAKPVADVFTIAVGFILRAAVGAAAVVVLISPWLLFCTGALALQLGFAKRRHELILQGGATDSREALRGYSRSALDALVVMSACVAMVFYGIYSLLSETARTHPSLFVTSLFVGYGICRYVYLVFQSDEGGEPENLVFGDRHMLVSIVLFLITAFLAMRGVRIPIVDGYQP